MYIYEFGFFKDIAEDQLEESNLIIAALEFAKILGVLCQLLSRSCHVFVRQTLSDILLDFRNDCTRLLYNMKKQYHSDR